MSSAALDAAAIARGLIPMDAERLTGWKGPPGAAYNVISESLCKRGLLNRDWSLSPLGLAVRAHLENQP
jgi:hypothetical protein